VVFDPQALAQQMVHYIVLCNQYATQSQQYSHQLQSLELENRQLQNLNFQSNLSGFNSMQTLMNSATGLSNDFTRVQSQFEQLYPDFNSYNTQGGASFASQAASWSRLNQQNALDILKTETKLQASMYQDQGTLQTLSNRSAAASGSKDLLQVLNQLVILQTKQLMQLEQLLSTTAKADAAYLAETASREGAAAARNSQTIESWSSTSTSVVNPNLGRLH
jgi:P-type conjugative transfer protein TrbJ